MPSRLLLSLAATLAVVLAACGPSPLLDVAELADGAESPPARPDLADAGDAEAAAWIRDEVDRSDRPVVVKFFASWCGPCEEEMPVLLAAREEHPEVAFLGVVHQDRREHVREWMDEFGGTELSTLFDADGETARTFGARGMPSVSFVDTEGQLLRTHTGPMDERLLEEWIAHLTGEGPMPESRPDAPVQNPQ